jgi:hypothetical protein
MTEVSSHIFAKEKASEAGNVMWYYFHSTAVAAGVAWDTANFIHTLLHQIINSLSEAKAMSVATAFLRKFLSAVFRHDRKRFRARNSPDTTPETPDTSLGDRLWENLRTVFSDSDRELWEAFSGIIDMVELRELSIVIIIDGVGDANNAHLLVRRIMEAHPNVRAFVTSRSTPHIGDISTSEGILYIEYDKERKGIYGLTPLA